MKRFNHFFIISMSLTLFGSFPSLMAQSTGTIIDVIPSPTEDKVILVIKGTEAFEVNNLTFVGDEIDYQTLIRMSGNLAYSRKRVNFIGEGASCPRDYELVKSTTSYEKTYSLDFNGIIENKSYTSLGSGSGTLLLTISNANLHTRLTEEFWTRIDSYQIITSPPDSDSEILDYLCNVGTIQQHSAEFLEGVFFFNPCWLVTPTYTMDCTSGQVVLDLPEGGSWADNLSLPPQRVVTLGVPVSIELTNQGECTNYVFTLTKSMQAELLHECVACADSYLTTCEPK